MTLLKNLHETFGTVVNYLFLNLLWLVFSLPVVTIPASATAMFGVINYWKNTGEEDVIRPFITEFKRYFFSSQKVGVIFLGLGLIPLTGFFYVLPKLNNFENMVLILLISFTLIYLLTTVFIFPALSRNDHVNSFYTIRYAFLVSISQFHIAMIALAVTAAMILVVYVFPITLFIGSSMALVINLLFTRALDKVDLLKQKYGLAEEV
ncbi:YesL family protein [Virgibacillus indicus]|nr:DUF624 domain-containing protein [Virgibacillus indicus]